MDIVKACATWCCATHLMDMAVAEYEGVFLPADDFSLTLRRWFYDLISNPLVRWLRGVPIAA